MEQAVRELEWQKKNTEKEIESIQSEAQELNQSIATKLPPLMVHIRTYRLFHCMENVILFMCMLIVYTYSYIVKIMCICL